MKNIKIKKLIENIKLQENETRVFLHLTANENVISKTARQFLNSDLAERYYFGGGKDSIVDFNPFTIRGLDSIQQIVIEAEDSLKSMLNAEEVNLNVLSGIHAMICTIIGSTEKDDLIMSIHPDDGGHFATETIIRKLGRKSIFAQINRSSMTFDYQVLAKTIKSEGVKTVYIDLMNYTHPFDVRKLRSLIGEDVIIIYDASHTIGLMLGGFFQSPLDEGADIICSNTHKTLPGPHKGLIAYKSKELGEKINSILAGKFYSSVHTNHLIALAITILEMDQFGKEYAKQMVKNSDSLAKALESRGYKIRKTDAKHTYNHQVHVFIENPEQRINLYKNLIDNNISTNFNMMSDDKLFLRLGTQEVTRRGMKEKDMRIIAEILHKSLQGHDTKEEISKLLDKFNSIFYSFDNL